MNFAICMVKPGLLSLRISYSFVCRSGYFCCTFVYVMWFLYSCVSECFVRGPDVNFSQVYVVLLTDLASKRDSERQI